MIKFIGLDVDGTLLGKGHKKVTKKNIEVIKKAQEAGIKISIASGRSPALIIPIAKQLGLVGDEFEHIGLNGGILFTIAENYEIKIIYEKTFDKKTSDFIFKTADENKISLFGYSQSKKNAFKAKYNGFFFNVFMGKRSKRKMISYSKNKEDVALYKVIAYGKTKNVVDFRKKMEQKKLEIFGWSYLEKPSSNIEVNPTGVDKLTGVKELCKMYKLKQSEVAFFGDGENDFRAIEWAGTGVAMDNARDKIKSVANFVTDHHIKSGVGNYIETILNNNK